jgi:hypothetical protein
MSFYTSRGASGALTYRFLIIFVLSLVSWAVLIAIVVALVEAVCAALRLVTQKQELCDAFSKLLGFF